MNILFKQIFSQKFYEFLEIGELNGFDSSKIWWNLGRRWF